jgi:hypothetical protein
MNGYLKQSTASQSRLIGPFIDDTDFKTAKTGLTIANTDIKLRANGTTLANKASGGGTHQVNGMYSVTWDATDTANVGELFYSVVVATALQVFGSYVVLEEAVYDALFLAAAPGYLQPTTAGRTLDVTATGAAGIDWANVENPTTAQNLSATNIDVDQVVASVSGAVGSVTGAVGSVTGAVGSVATGGITTGSFAAGAINAAAIATDAIGAAELAADAVAEIADAIWDEARAGHVTGGSFGEGVASVQGNVTGSVASVATGGIAATSFAAGAIDAAAIAANAIGSAELDATAGVEIADALLDRDMATGTDTGSSTVRTVRQALRALRNKVGIAAGTLTVTKEDDVTASWTGAVTTAAGDPITQIDPVGP